MKSIFINIAFVIEIFKNSFFLKRTTRTSCKNEVKMDETDPLFEDVEDDELSSDLEFLDD